VESIDGILAQAFKSNGFVEKCFVSHPNKLETNLADTSVCIAIKPSNVIVIHRLLMLHTAQESKTKTLHENLAFHTIF
jgi:hypothetical protein